MRMDTLKMADAAIGYFSSDVMAESKDATKVTITESTKYKERIYGKSYLKIISKHA